MGRQRLLRRRPRLLHHHNRRLQRHHLQLLRRHLPPLRRLLTHRLPVGGYLRLSSSTASGNRHLQRQSLHPRRRLRLLPGRLRRLLAETSTHFWIALRRRKPVARRTWICRQPSGGLRSRRRRWPRLRAAARTEACAHALQRRLVGGGPLRVRTGRSPSLVLMFTAAETQA